nr:hypothetical protein [Tanacetum cinerariifolium]
MKPTRKFTQVPQPSDPIEHVADKTVHKEVGDSLVRASTTASSLEAEQDSGNINKTQSKATPNESSSQRTNSGGGPRCQEAIGILLLKLGRIPGDEESLGEHASKQWRIKAIDVNEDITVVNVQDDAKMFDVNDLGGEEVFVAEQEVVKDVNENVIEEVVNAAQDSAGIVIQEQEEPVNQQQQRQYLNNNHKTRGKHFEAFRLELVERKQKRAGEELIQESTKKQKVDDDKEKAELKQLMETILDEEEVAIDVIPLAVKSPRIVD